MATTQTTISEASWTQISTLKAFTAQNTSTRPYLIAAAASQPSASSVVGFRLMPGEVFNNSHTDRTWWATIDSNGSDTEPITIEET